MLLPLFSLLLASPASSNRAARASFMNASPLSLIALSFFSTAHAQKAGSIVPAGNTMVSAMMMFLGNEEKVYIMDKAENNAQRINDHPAWASIWDINTHETTPMDFKSNAFCASGMHFPNGSFVTFGGNGAIGPDGNIGSVFGDGTGAYDETYKDFDGGKAIRVIDPCTGSDAATNPNCQWFDDASVLAMKKRRWYSTAEALADGSVVLIGGFQQGGYVNRNYPNLNPDDGAENTYEFWPSRGDPVTMPFMRKTSGLNSYAHAFLMPSGKMLVQANYSTILWDYNTGEEIDLPDMPNQIIRVYPASGAVAMLPLTPANGYTPTLLFCGGSDLTEYQWGNFSWPFVNTWEVPASPDCQRLTPEPVDKSTPKYEQDDDMLEGRTMGQFIALPDGTMLVVNGAANGTAGYSTRTFDVESYSDMPYGMSLASGPVGTPAIYNPNLSRGSRWSNAGLDTSNIPRMYHSVALLLPDASVLIAGSNPNVDVNTTTIYPTTYAMEIFYPPYFGAKTRPIPSGIPKTIGYGGSAFDITVAASSYSGSANDAAKNTTVVLIRPGWTTHALNMGQRMLQLNNTYTVQSDGSYVLHTAPVPPNANLLTPGPVLLFVVVNGIPSNGTQVIIGNGKIGQQPLGTMPVLPTSVLLDEVKGGADANSTQTTSSGSDSSQENSGNSANSGATSHTGTTVGIIVGVIAAVAVVGAIVGAIVVRRKRAARAQGSRPRSYPIGVVEDYSEVPASRGSFLTLQSTPSAVHLMDSEQHRPQGRY